MVSGTATARSRSRPSLQSPALKPKFAGARQAARHAATHPGTGSDRRRDGSPTRARRAHASRVDSRRNSIADAQTIVDEAFGQFTAVYKFNSLKEEYEPPLAKKDLDLLTSTLTGGRGSNDSNV